MEHIVQFGVTIDDDAIMKLATEKASKTIAQDVREQFFVCGYSGHPKYPTEEAWEHFDKVLEECKPQIIEMAAEKLFEYLKRTKAVRAAVGDTVRRAEE